MKFGDTASAAAETRILKGQALSGGLADNSNF